MTWAVHTLAGSRTYTGSVGIGEHISLAPANLRAVAQERNQGFAGTGSQHWDRRGYWETGGQVSPGSGNATGGRPATGRHAHLYALANHAAGRTARPVSRVSRVVRPGVRQLLETVRPCPAYVLTRTSDLLAANPEALALLDGLTDWPPERRNTIRYTFLAVSLLGMRRSSWPRAVRAGLVA